MAIVQISRITNRKGLAVDLPQLAGAELGWNVDTRQLFIGNGTLEEGAPVIGNTEILTEFSDIFNLATSYTYSGQAATGYSVQTGVAPGTPVVQSLQNWLDQFATVKDFGAVGDGETDDTAAINRALYQLYCREANPEIRRALFFPAGVYKVTGTIYIPTWANLYGEGIRSSVIQMDNSDDSTQEDYVARTVDSLFQSGVNIGTNGATPPQGITLTNLGFRNLQATNVFLIEYANQVTATNVSFIGSLTTADLDNPLDDTAAVRISSSNTYVTQDIVFEGCQFSGTTYGFAPIFETENQSTKGVSITNCKFDTLYQGVTIGTGAPGGTPSGIKILSNFFDNIYAEGITIQDAELNATGYNIFYDVGNNFGGDTLPATPIINIDADNTVSVGDMFSRPDVYAAIEPRISLNQKTSIAFTNGSQIQLGTYTRQSGQVATLVNNTTSPAALFTVDTDVTKAFVVNYTVIRDQAYRTGTFTVVSEGGTSIVTSDDYSENDATGMNWVVTQVTTTVTVAYTLSNLGTPANLTYSVNYLG